MRTFRSSVFVGLTVLALAAGGVLQAGRARRPGSVPLPQILQPRLTRPYGMAPIAWNAYLRACKQAKIHPLRLGQTIGDNPRSVGYHKRDGVLRSDGQSVDYTAAVDLGTQDLTPTQISAFLNALSDQGFAAWYRHQGKWKGGEHIHAIYTFLPMKPQLQIQLKEFLREKRRAGKSPKWRAKLKSQQSKLKHWMIW